MKSRVAQPEHVVSKLADQRLKSKVGDIGCDAIPGRHQAQVIEHRAELATDNPAVVGEPFLAVLHSDTAFADRMNQFNPVGIPTSRSDVAAKRASIHWRGLANRRKRRARSGKLGNRGRKFLLTQR